LALLSPLRFFSERMRSLLAGLFVFVCSAGGAHWLALAGWSVDLLTLDLVRAFLALPNSDEKDEMMKPNCSQPRDEFSVSNQTSRVRGG